VAGINCCYNCPDRTIEPNCHTSCEKYLSQKEAWEKQKEAMREADNVSWGLTAQRKRLYYTVYKRKNYEGKYKKR
jgi:hypothetical protein